MNSIPSPAASLLEANTFVSKLVECRKVYWHQACPRSQCGSGSRTILGSDRPKCNQPDQMRCSNRPLRPSDSHSAQLPSLGRLHCGKDPLQGNSSNWRRISPNCWRKHVDCICLKGSYLSSRCLAHTTDPPTIWCRAEAAARLTENSSDIGPPGSWVQRARPGFVSGTIQL